jgi:hypothetical protein
MSVKRRRRTKYLRQLLREYTIARERQRWLETWVSRP